IKFTIAHHTKNDICSIHDALPIYEKSFAKSAGEWLTERQVKMVGLDLPNIDVNDNMKREVHLEVLGNNIYIIENLVNLEQLPKRSEEHTSELQSRFDLVCRLLTEI